MTTCSLRAGLITAQRMIMRTPLWSLRQITWRSVQTFIAVTMSIICFHHQVFPDTYHGSPNVTITPEGRRYYPEKRHNNLEVPVPGLLESSWASETRPSLSGPPDGESSVIQIILIILCVSSQTFCPTHLSNKYPQSCCMVFDTQMEDVLSKGCLGGCFESCLV